MGMFANLLDFDDAVSWRRSVDQLEGASFFMSKKTRLRAKVDCKLVDRAVGDYKNEDACALPETDVSRT